MQMGWNTHSDQQAEVFSDSPLGAETGLIAGTCVGTPMGWRPVQSIQAGDLVLTFDNGMQPVKQVSSGQLWTSADHGSKKFWPLHIPAGALDNVSPLTVLSSANIMLETDLTEALYDDPFALVPAHALDGTRGIEAKAPGAPLDIVSLHFENDQVVFANGSTLIFCPSADGAQPVSIEELIFGGAEGAYGTLPETELQAVIDDLQFSIPESRVDEP